MNNQLRHSRTSVARWMTRSYGTAMQHLARGTVVGHHLPIPARLETAKQIVLQDGTIGWFDLFFLTPISPLEQLALCAEDNDAHW